MSKIKIKNKAVLKKKIFKNKAKKKAVILHKKRNKTKNATPDIIFDSSLGNTDALFISSPQDIANFQPPIVTPGITVSNDETVKKEIDNILKEFDEDAQIQNLNNAGNKTEIERSVDSPLTSIGLSNLNDSNNMDNQKPIDASPLLPEDAPKKKKGFSWRKFFSLNNHLFSILIGLVFAGVFCAGMYVLADPTASKYTPGETTTPACVPGTLNCTVESPVPYTGATQNVDLGTENITSSAFFLHKVGSSQSSPSYTVLNQTSTGGTFEWQREDGGSGGGIFDWTPTTMDIGVPLATENIDLTGQLYLHSPSSGSGDTLGWDPSDGKVILVSGGSGGSSYWSQNSDYSGAYGNYGIYPNSSNNVVIDPANYYVGGQDTYSALDVNQGNGDYAINASGDVQVNGSAVFNNGDYVMNGVAGDNVLRVNSTNSGGHSFASIIGAGDTGNAALFQDDFSGNSVELSNGAYAIDASGDTNLTGQLYLHSPTSGSGDTLGWNPTTGKVILVPGGGGGSNYWLIGSGNWMGAKQIYPNSNDSVVIDPSDYYSTYSITPDQNSALNIVQGTGDYAINVKGNVLVVGEGSNNMAHLGGVIAGETEPNAYSVGGIYDYSNNGGGKYYGYLGIQYSEVEQYVYGGAGGSFFYYPHGSTTATNAVDLSTSSYAINASGDVNIVGNLTVHGTLNIAGATSGSSWTITLPGSVGTSGQVMMATDGIGDTSWTYALNPNPSNSNTSSQTVAIDWSGVQESDAWLSFDASGNAHFANSVDPNGSDLAENYPTTDTTLSAGEIVSLDIVNPGFVTRANSANSSMAFGVISTNPGMKLGSKQYKNDNQVAVALAGRVPLNVDGEGGAINVGDRIALSTGTAGVGMKASSGQNTIGVALEPFNGTNSAATGTILVFVQNQQYSLNSSGAIGSGQVSGVAGETFLQSVNDSLVDLGISIKNGVVGIASLAVDNFNAKTARMQEIEMVAANGDIYCSWIDGSGDWQKVKGVCSSVGPSVQSVINSSAANSTANSLTNPNSNQSPLEAAQQAANQAQAAAAQATQAAHQAVQQTNQQVQQAANQAQAAAAQATQAAQQATQAAQQAQPLTISSVAPFSDISVAYGTSLAEANLPATVVVTLSDSTTQAAAVAWDSGNPIYDPNTSGEYVFSGTLGFSGNITNTNSLKATVNVIVAPQPAPVAAQPSAGSNDIVQRATSGLINGAGDFLRWMLVTPVKTLSSFLKR